jgi:hypothetical protein
MGKRWSSVEKSVESWGKLTKNFFFLMGMFFQTYFSDFPPENEIFPAHKAFVSRQMTKEGS